MRYVLIILALLPAAARAQNVSSSLSGSVRDSAGAVMPGIEVRLTNERTSFLRTTSTNAEGFFVLPNLDPGSYSLQISAPGFKRYTQSGIQLTAGEQRSAGILEMALGEVTESVTVSADLAPVMLGSSDRTGVLTGQEIEKMALRGRDFLDAVGLLPGIVDTSDSREAPDNKSDGALYILGARSNQKNITLDGVANLDSGGNSVMHNAPSMDAVGEIKVMMSNYAAEYGRNSGGTISIITRGGGRDFHASAGWYHRHENYSANNYFDNRNGVARPRYRYNIAGYTVSGPIYIPGKFNSDRSKMFFFFSQEFQRQMVMYGTRTVRVPTELERRGDFSQSMDVNNRAISVLDPLAGRTQFPGNIVPASRLDGVGKNILSFFPTPNFVDPLVSRRAQWNYISSVSSPYPRRTEIARVDYSPRQNVQFYLRLSNTYDERYPSYGLGVTGSVNYPLTEIVFRYPGRGAALHNTVSLSPSMVNEFTFGVSQQKAQTYPRNPEEITRAATGITVGQWYPGLNAAGLIPNMTFAGVPNYANPSMDNRLPYYNANTIFNFTENLSKVWGTHSVKVGFYVERTRKDQGSNVPVRGVFAFGVDSTNANDANYAYANALLGNFTNYSEATANPQGQFRFTNFEWYVQDAWRVRPRLLLDFGVRFYHNMPQYDARDQLSVFVPGLYDAAKAPVLLLPGYNSQGKKAAIDPLTGTAYPSSYIGTFVPGVGDPSIGMAIAGENGFPRGMYTVPGVSAAPRFGFSWDPFGKGRTAIRGGGGVFFDRALGGVNMTQVQNPPTIYTPTVYYGTLAGLTQMAGVGILAPGSSMYSLIGHNSLATVYNFSLGVQQQLSRDMIVDVSYVGSLSRHLLYARNINAVPIGARFLDLHPENRDPTTTASALSTNFLRPYQGFGDILMEEPGATSNYNSLQVNVNRRMRHGSQFGLAYTFSKTLGVAASDSTAVSPFFAPRERNYGLLAFDRTHYLTLRYNFTLPKPGKRLGSRTLGIFADGWELAGISRFTSGAPFTPGYSLVDGQDITGTPSESARIDVVDPSAPAVSRFGRPARGTFGNAGVGILRGPGVNNWDISLYRHLKLWERLAAQLRLETYNTFNHTQFSTLSTTARFDAQGSQIEPLFLTPTAARPPRRVQLALRLNW